MPSGPQLPASQFGDSWYSNPERLDVAILLLVGFHGAASLGSTSSPFCLNAFTAGTITLGARCNELFLLSARYEIRAASSVYCVFVPPNLY